ncbi:MAG: cytochrome-c peroxidase, partial [Nitrosomonas sp.]|nr:cytochrome-c peroxidase [Nitrosomonas sp.]
MISNVVHAEKNMPMAITDNDYYSIPSQAKVALGKVLFYDKILSGNQNISCATCHHSLTGTGDGLALPVGEGGKGLGVTRDTGSGGDTI